MRSSLHLLLLLLLPVLVLPLVTCGEESDDDDEDCPSFDDYQVYPEIGGPNNVFELFVRLKDKSANQHVERVYGQLYYSNGEHAGVTFDLVRTETDHLRYLRTFRGYEVCENGTCSLYFKVIAEHEKGCKKAFETDMFQVVIDEGDDDIADDDTQ
ncbi:MAG: hypothetical protein ACTSXZ_05825 [Alphaproteobacteria bacterium]